MASSFSGSVPLRHTVAIAVFTARPSGPVPLSPPASGPAP
jgi:hypothetical protein